MGARWLYGHDDISLLLSLIVIEPYVAMIFHGTSGRKICIMRLIDVFYTYIAIGIAIVNSTLKFARMTEQVLRNRVYKFK